MVELAGRGKKWTDHSAVREELEASLKNGTALAKFRLMVEAQGGEVAAVDNPDLLPKARIRSEVGAAMSGYVAEISADKIAQGALALGAGREKKDDSIDHAVGIEVFVKVGQRIAAGEAIARIHANSESQLEEARRFVNGAVLYSAEVVEPLPLFYGVIDGRSKR
jgi:pyrimidine-nucleoside phosphorylase